MKALKLILAIAAAFAAAPAFATQALTFVVTNPPTTFEDGTPLGVDDKPVYLVFDQTGKQLFSTFTLETRRTDVPDTSTCFFAKVALYDKVTNNTIPGSISDAGPSDCPAPLVRKLGKIGLKTTR